MSAARPLPAWTPDSTLTGNADACPACTLRREALPVDPMAERPAHVDCQLCDGSGRLPVEAAELVARAVAWAREHYWPEVKARWTQGGGL